MKENEDLSKQYKQVAEKITAEIKQLRSKRDIAMGELAKQDPFSPKGKVLIKRISACNLKLERKRIEANSFLSSINRQMSLEL